MKKILPIVLFLAASCSSTTDSDATHQAIGAYMKANANDPTSYEAVRWGKSQPFMRSDSANLAGIALLKSNIRTERDKGGALIDGPGKDSVTQIGTVLTHAFRGKNKLGALVLDSAQFVVYKNGQVQPL